ncbi:MAG: TIGR03560 family F420-dependent LLM class oxidoreductase [Chloroflexota bacterium]|nr:TIGR03560 family F420-dependent LLM class oxidoreductase [Chloroflexota bacterium]
MIEVAIMIEGQNGLTWERWQRIATAVEEGGFVGLYRSDHFTNPEPPNIDSLECWISLAWLASHTKRIEFGPLVSPVSFRDPVMLARQALAVDDLSGGRLTFGVGAGWQVREHANFGYELLDKQRRLARFEESVEVMSRLLRSDEPVSFEGQFYRLHEAILLPRPNRAGGPPLLIGGNGPQRTLPLAARYATEWNGVMAPPATIAERNRQLDELLRQQGRQPADLRRSFMTNVVFGRDDAEVTHKLQGRDASELQSRGFMVGTADAVVAQIGAYADAGVQRIMLQWLDLDDLDGLAALAQDVLPQL